MNLTSLGLRLISYETFIGRFLKALHLDVQKFVRNDMVVKFDIHSDIAGEILSESDAGSPVRCHFF